MVSGRFVAYYRVSTAKQGASGLGLEAQRSAVQAYLNGGSWTLVNEFTEVESGKRSDRPQLAAAMAACRIHGATLVIAKLDRLSRDAAFLLSLRDAGVDFIAADMPNANRLTVGIMACVAEAEREAISARTKAALAAAKERGRKLGGDRGNLSAVCAEGNRVSACSRAAKAAARARDLAPIIAAIRQSGITSANGIARELNARGIRTARGGTWQAAQVQLVIKHLSAQ
jgi:DNA invertase Pin-like site-specific DNA recombinase